MKLLDKIRALIKGSSASHVHGEKELNESGKDDLSDYASEFSDSNSSDDSSDKDFISNRKAESNNPFVDNNEFVAVEGAKFDEKDNDTHSKHSDYVNEALEKFHEAKISNLSNDIIEI